MFKNKEIHRLAMLPYSSIDKLTLISSSHKVVKVSHQYKKHMYEVSDDNDKIFCSYCENILTYLRDMLEASRSCSLVERKGCGLTNGRVNGLRKGFLYSFFAI